MQNFLDCIRSGKEPNCPFEVGFASPLPADGRGAYRQGRTCTGTPRRKNRLKWISNTHLTDSTLRRSVREFAEAEIKPPVMSGTRRRSFPLGNHPKLVSSATWVRYFLRAGWRRNGIRGVFHHALKSFPSRRVGRIIVARTSLCSNHIFKMGDDQQRARYLPSWASANGSACWSLTETEAGSDAPARAPRPGFRATIGFNGAKDLHPNAHYADVWRRHGGTDRGDAQHGISAFVIEKGTPGFRAGKKENKLGLRPARPAR